MKIQSIALATVFVTFVFAGVPTAGLAAGPEAPRETITPAFAHTLANVTGRVLTALVVTYPPGGKTPPHRHGQAFVIGYVLEGAIRSRIDNGNAQVFHAGESWTENPGVHHIVSENASGTKPAKLLAVFIADATQKDLVTLDHN
ncbi:MAG TPA: cupin domain-containing protein [Chthoniobacterales bacterium]